MSVVLAGRGTPGSAEGCVQSPGPPRDSGAACTHEFVCVHPDTPAVSGLMVRGAHAEGGVYMQARLGPVHGSRGRLHPQGREPGQAEAAQRPPVPREPRQAEAAQRPSVPGALGHGGRPSGPHAACRAPRPAPPQCCLQKLAGGQRGGPAPSRSPGASPVSQARPPRCQRAAPPGFWRQDGLPFSGL